MKNYYDYGCGKGEYGKSESAFEAKNRHGYEEWSERDHHEERRDCHCAKVYTMNKHDDCERDYDREDKCECRKHDREYEGKCECKHDREDKKHYHECEKNEDECECFLVKVCVPPFPFRCKK